MIVLCNLSVRRSKKYIAFCTSGYRSVLAVSILRANGFNAIDIYGGFAAISVYASDLTTTGQVREFYTSIRHGPIVFLFTSTIFCFCIYFVLTLDMSQPKSHDHKNGDLFLRERKLYYFMLTSTHHFLLLGTFIKMYH